MNAEPFVAHAEERLYAAAAAETALTRRRALALGAAALLYALLSAVVLWEARFAVAPPPTEEIPVEIVVEPPPPPKAAPPPPPQASLDEKPATDAPRAGQAEKDSGEAQKEAKPPPAPAAEPADAKPAGAEAKGKAPNPQATAEPAPKPAPPSPPLNADDGQAPPPAAAPEVASREPPSPAKPMKPAGKPAPMFDSVPDVDFGGAAMKAPVSGGHAKATYLSMLYGKIMPLIHKPTDARSAVGRGFGAVAFEVDGQGRLINRWIAEPSGSPALDQAVFNAIGAASPFPPTPTGGAVGLRFTYNAN